MTPAEPRERGFWGQESCGDGGFSQRKPGNPGGEGQGIPVINRRWA